MDPEKLSIPLTDKEVVSEVLTLLIKTSSTLTAILSAQCEILSHLTGKPLEDVIQNWVGFSNHLAKSYAERLHLEQTLGASEPQANQDESG